MEFHTASPAREFHYVSEKEIVFKKKIKLLKTLLVFLCTGFSALSLSMVMPVANAEELYTLVNANGQLTDGATLVCSDAVCGPNGSFSTNPT